MIEPVTATEMRQGFARMMIGFGDPLGQLIALFGERNDVSLDALMSRSRGPHSRPRQDLWRYLHRVVGYTQADLGRRWGHADHTSVRSGIVRSEARMRAGKVVMQ